MIYFVIGVIIGGCLTILLLALACTGELDTSTIEADAARCKQFAEWYGSMNQSSMAAAAWSCYYAILDQKEEE